jgi:hypothetical protein
MPLLSLKNKIMEKIGFTFSLLSPLLHFMYSHRSILLDVKINVSTTMCVECVIYISIE